MFKILTIEMAISYISVYDTTQMNIIQCSAVCIFRITVGVTIERMIAFKFPIHLRVYVTRYRVMITIALVYLFTLVVSIYVHVTQAGLDRYCINNSCKLFVQLEQNQTCHASVIVYAITCVIFPLVLVVILATAIIHALHKSSKFRRDQTSADSRTALVVGKRESRTTMKVIFNAVSFVAFNATCAVAAILALQYTTSTAPEWLIVLRNAANILVMINKASNFVLYSLASRQYRRRLVRVIKCEICRGCKYRSIHKGKMCACCCTCASSELFNQYSSQLADAHYRIVNTGMRSIQFDISFPLRQVSTASARSVYLNTTQKCSNALISRSGSVPNYQSIAVAQPRLSLACAVRTYL